MTALNTTKRKFAKLLENLTAPSSTSPIPSSKLNASLSTLSNNASEPPSKRSRLSDIENEFFTTPTKAPALRTIGGAKVAGHSSSNNGSPSSLRLVRGATSSKTSQGTFGRNPKAPNYAPYSQEQFLARLKTFADVKLWTSKPERINEVAWAKRGWVLESWNKVACKGGCEQRLSIRLRAKRKDEDGNDIEGTEDELLEVDDELVDRYEELITTSHNETCLWRRGGCKADIYHTPLARRENCERGIVERYESLLSVAASLPPIESLSIPGESPENYAVMLPDSVLAPVHASLDTSTDTPLPNLVALTLALFGWTGLTQSTLSLLFCPLCFQRIGLWMYTSERIAQMSSTLDLDQDHLRLKVADAHRDHCPWRNAVSQHNPPDGPLNALCAWETVQHTLKRTSQRRSEATSRPQTPIGRDEDEDEDDETAEVQLTPAELEKQDKERTTKWRKLRARMSFRRPKSSNGEKAPPSRGKSITDGI